LSKRKKWKSIKERIRNVDIRERRLRDYVLTGVPPDAYPDEEFFDPESYHEKKIFWDNVLRRYRAKKRKRCKHE